MAFIIQGERFGRTLPHARRSQYDAKLCGYLEEYDRAFIVHADNVGSKQFMDIRAVRPQPRPSHPPCEARCCGRHALSGTCTDDVPLRLSRRVSVAIRRCSWAKIP